MKKIVLGLVFFPLFLIGQTSLTEAQKLIESKQFYKAEKVLIPFVNNNPDNIQATELLGDAFGYQKKWDEAITQYKLLVEAKPTEANFHYKYGGALGMKALNVTKIRAIGIIGDVKEAFLKAAQLDPNHVDTRWALVELYMQLPGIIGGSKSKSFKYANELEKLSKVDGYLAKGYIYEYDKEPELAEKFYKLAIKEGGSITCYDKLTKFYEKEGKSIKAISNLEAAHVKHKRNAMHYQIGKVCADYNVQLEKGEFCLKVYIDNYSSQDGVPKAWAYYRLAQIYKHKKDKDEALIWIDKAITDLPEIDVFKEFKETLH
ncbi:tetratricopeptide repeat protein [Lacinutrix sp.]|uniref:tetratricopeptide repeat protein n=1 Tax=Lacinutrix sp. TaxID=1937692 RepID=UPI002628F755|nr:tetratricopeptide repeat protein [Lacinutrix sp.]MDG1715722.1 tetratricopeptide repeat protein [Lacinutrix sp.]